MHDGNPSLQDILQSVRVGDRKGQKMLYETYYSYAKNVCLHYGSNEQEAVEILNDAFLNVFKHIEMYDASYSFKTWLRKILINKAIDYFRKYHKFKSNSTLDPAEIILFSEEDYSSFDKLEDLVPCLRKLSPMYRMVLNLHILEDLSHEEIANKLNISVSTSRSNLFRAIENLRKYMNSVDQKAVKTKI